ncbi:MAG: hypothetical protein ABL949_08560 [Fimbriimonadaceae bacterium]
MALPPHIPLAVQIFPHLAECANGGKRTNTDELCAFVGGKTRLFSRSLAWIRDTICVEHNLPPITAIVQNTGKDTPSNSFNPTQLALLKKDEYDQLRAETLEKVYAYPRWTAVNDALQEMFLNP